jgi:hypothetical protein
MGRDIWVFDREPKVFDEQPCQDWSNGKVLMYIRNNTVLEMCFPYVTHASYGYIKDIIDTLKEKLDRLDEKELDHEDELDEEIFSSLPSDYDQSDVCERLNRAKFSDHTMLMASAFCYFVLAEHLNTWIAYS